MRRPSRCTSGTDRHPGGPGCAPNGQRWGPGLAESPLKDECLYSLQVGLEDPKGPSTVQVRRWQVLDCWAAHGKSCLFPLTTQKAIFYNKDILYMTCENLTHSSSKMLNILEIHFYFAWLVSVHRIGYIFIGLGARWKCRLPVQKLPRISKWRKLSIEPSARSLWP